MCLGAILNCRIGTVVYGASQQKQGAFSAYGLAPKKLKVISGIEKKQIEKLMKSFFKSIRSKNKK
jgi:tRNA(Arg) A34 adenosine deaminase TadA